MSAGGRAPLRLAVPDDLHRLPHVCATIREFLASSPADARRVDRAEMLVEEVLTNVIRHGGRDGRDVTIDIEIDATVEFVALRITDDGIAFDPRDAPPFDVEKPLHLRTSGGMGIHLMRSFAREIRYERRDGRNRLELVV